jgi:hypothetical protein
MQVLSLVAVAGISATCLIFGKPIAGVLFSEASSNLSAVTRHDLLTVGLAVIGVSLITGALPAVIQFVGRLVWFGEASRQSQLGPILEQSWESLSFALLEMAIGLALALKAGSVATFIDTREGVR